MSTPEFTPNAYLIRSKVYPHDVHDDIQDILWLAEGKKTAKNDTNSICGGENPIRECAASTELAKQIIGRFIAGIDPEPVDETNPKPVNVIQRIEVDSSCGDCGMLCHAYGRTINGKPSERIRFMYEDPEATVLVETASSGVGEQ